MKKISRRTFVAAATVAPASALHVNSESKDIFVHHVLFYLKNPKSEADKAKLLEGLKTLKKIPQIKFFHIGTPADRTRPVIVKDYNFSVLSFFDSSADEEIYQKHPIHLKFVEGYSHLWEKVVIYDAIGPRL